MMTGEETICMCPIPRPTFEAEISKLTDESLCEVISNMGTRAGEAWMITLADELLKRLSYRIGTIDELLEQLRQERAKNVDLTRRIRSRLLPSAKKRLPMR